MAKELTHAGVVKIVENFHGIGAEWDSFFQGTRYLRIFFAYARTWRSVHGERVKEFAHAPGHKISVVLPDP
ncbi:MAG TPA: hypothetical protein VFE78_33655, partial [Gemmataceae bacterium]|nr:hypothetical protein [Gemmataceae bacterium]